MKQKRDPGTQAARTIVIWTVAAALGLAFVMGVLSGLARGQTADTSKPIPDTTSTTYLRVEARTIQGTPIVTESYKNVSSNLGLPVIGQVSLVSANIPVAVATATAPVGASTPTPTPNSFVWCHICNPVDATAVVVWGTSSSVTTSTGGRLAPGRCVRGLPALNGDCGGYYVVSATASQSVDVIQER